VLSYITGCKITLFCRNNKQLDNKKSVKALFKIKKIKNQKIKKLKDKKL